jgi:ribulose-5-phosphate 4-epimerase/fuculose-1-phosphate aldolase
MTATASAASHDGARSTDAEWQRRVELAAVYHLLRKYRMTDLTNQYCAARVDGGFVTQRYGDFNEEITASNLIKVGWDLENREPAKGAPNPAGSEISKAVFEARPEINCIMHVHTRNILGVSTLKCGLRPLSQAALMIGGLDEVRYQGFGFDHESGFCDQLVRAFDGRKILIEAHHGAFILSETPAEAFFKTFYLDQACNVQLTGMSTGADLIEMTDQEYQQLLSEMWSSRHYRYDGQFEWPALLRALDRESPSYRT